MLLLRFSSLALALLLAAGCAGPSPKPVAPAAPVVTSREPFVALDAAARASLEAAGFFERRLADGRLDVLADVRNRGAAAATARVQCLFYGGNVPDQTTAWQSIAIGPGETVTVHFTAVNSGPGLYSVRVELGRIAL